VAPTTARALALDEAIDSARHVPIGATAEGVNQVRRCERAVRGYFPVRQGEGVQRPRERDGRDDARRSAFRQEGRRMTEHVRGANGFVCQASIVPKLESLK
jgi:hypothetical protein